MVEKFFQALPYESFEGMMGRCELFIRLLSDKFAAFYHTYDCLDEDVLIEFFENLNLGEFQTLIESADTYGIDFFYKKYKHIFFEAIQAAIFAYMEDVQADDYYGDYDMDDLFKHNMRYNGYYEELDKESVTDIVCDFIKEDVEREVSEMVGKLPQDILNRIRISKDDINIERLDVEGYIEGCLEPSEPEYDHHERDYDYGIAGELDVLDCIFK